MHRTVLLSLGLASGLLIAGGACDSKVVSQLEHFADKACACADTACGEAVQREYAQWWRENRKSKGSDRHRKRAEKAAQKFADCAAKLGVGDLDIHAEATEDIEDVPKVAPGPAAPVAPDPAPPAASDGPPAAAIPSAPFMKLRRNAAQRPGNAPAANRPDNADIPK